MDGYLLIESIDQVRTEKTFVRNDYRSTMSQYTETRLFLRMKYKMQPTEALVLVVMYTDMSEINKIVDYINECRFSKLYFFVEDVFRLSLPNKPADCIDRSLINRYPTEVIAGELEIISQILNQTAVEYEIYHNEYNSSFFEKKYNLTINYFDIFSASIPVNKWMAYQFTSVFDFKISCFNLRKDIIRFYIVALLYGSPCVILTLGNHFTVGEVIDNQQLPVNKFRPDITKKILETTEFFNNNNVKLEWDIAFDQKIDIKYFEYSDVMPAVVNSFLSLVTETSYYYPMPNIGEKTLKPIVAHRPFIMIAPAGTIALLKNLKFKTFDQWWDESYDLIIDNHKRLEAIYDIVETILKKDNQELVQMLNEMQPVLEHNYKNLRHLRTNMCSINHLE